MVCNEADRVWIPFLRAFLNLYIALFARFLKSLEGKILLREVPPTPSALDLDTSTGA
jgi:hypothetical protein